MLNWFRSRQTLVAYIATLEEKNDNLADLATEKHAEVAEYMAKLKKMHRRAQRAEGLLAKARPKPQKWDLIGLHQRNAEAFERQAHRLEGLCRIAYRHLHTAWLHYTSGLPPLSPSNYTDANEVASIEAMLREELPGIELPTKQEEFARG